MKSFFSKLKYIFSDGGYNPYWNYWFDLLTERHLKNRLGKCEDCLECCKFNDDSGRHCEQADLKTKRCKIYNKRTCDQWFPVSPKELALMYQWKLGFKCKFSWKN